MCYNLSNHSKIFYNKTSHFDYFDRLSIRLNELKIRLQRFASWAQSKGRNTKLKGILILHTYLFFSVTHQKTSFFPWLECVFLHKFALGKTKREPWRHIASYHPHISAPVWAEVLFCLRFGSARRRDPNDGFAITRHFLMAKWRCCPTSVKTCHM